MKIEIICPLFNAEKYIENLHQSFLNQKDIDDLKITYILTRSIDNTQLILDNLNASYTVIAPHEFSHSLTREKAAMSSEADIVVFVTQDVCIKRDDWLINLVKGIYNGEYAAAYSRQLCMNNSIEKYTRENNYPSTSFVVSKSDIGCRGLRTFFFSDASGAVDLKIFKKLNGYDQKKLPISEDMYFAHKLIMNGYKIKYCADSIVEHSHDFTLKELYKRYYLTGKFFSENSYLDQYGTVDSGLSMAIYIFKRALKDKNIYVLRTFIPNMFVRYIGMRKGKKNG